MSEQQISPIAHIRRLSAENERLRKIEAIAIELVEECKEDRPPALGTMARLADALHSAWKARQQMRHPSDSQAPPDNVP